MKTAVSLPVPPWSQSLRMLGLWLLLGILAAVAAFFLAGVSRALSLVLLPGAWGLSALPDRWALMLLTPLNLMGELFSPERWEAQVHQMIFLGMALVHFPLYAMGLWWASRRGRLKAGLLAVFMFHTALVGVAGGLCVAYGWPNKADEGQHAREGGEIYGR